MPAHGRCIARLEVFDMVAHCPGKTTVPGMTRQLALEGAPAIRANTISPGQFATVSSY